MLNKNDNSAAAPLKLYKLMYLVLSIAYRRVKDNAGALRNLTSAVMRYPKFMEAYLARGQIYLAEKKYDKALSDFRSVINLNQNSGVGFIGQGDALKHTGNEETAL